MNASYSSGILVYPAEHSYDYWVSTGYTPYLDEAQLANLVVKSRAAAAALLPFQEYCRLESVGLDREKQHIGLSIAYIRPSLLPKIHRIIEGALGVEKLLLPVEYSICQNIAKPSVTVAEIQSFPDYLIPEISRS
ncbi:hypothetical protein H7171_00145 [Candidatus Saccharibacteria bacterium]|nr:hypothetical protein [Candidatus Saccharibacteria bacterium]